MAVSSVRAQDDFFKGKTVSVVIGALYGAVSGYFGGRLDAIMMRFVDIFYSIPFLFILILTWSEYLLALIITKTQVTTLPIELSKYQGSTEGRVYGRQAALAVGITIPLMIVGLIIRKHLARGFSFGMVRR